jgi:prolyl-tRNA editing enzyme YbaK/EbsC (Cys-tRNA(Pro) deacylase)
MGRVMAWLIAAAWMPPRSSGSSSAPTRSGSAVCSASRANPLPDRRTVIATDEIELQVRRVLDGLGLPHEMVEIDPQYADTAAFCAQYGFPMEQSANTIIVGSKKEPKRYCACVVRATKRVDVNHTVRKLLGVSRLSFADPEETRALTGMMLGGVTVFALPADLPIYVDEGLMPMPWIILGGGSRSLKVKISPEVFRVLPGAAVTPELVSEP